LIGNDQEGTLMLVKTHFFNLKLYLFESYKPLEFLHPLIKKISSIKIKIFIFFIKN